MQQKKYIKGFIDLYTEINEFQKCSNSEQVFKTTTGSIRAISDLNIPENRNDFEKLIKNLYILLYEGSGDLKRLNLKNDEQQIIKKIRELRHNFEHDREHGKDSEVKKKFSIIGEIFEFLIDKKYPTTNEDWTNSGIVLIEELCEFLKKFLEDLENPSTVNEEGSKSLTFTRFYEHEFTLFPKGKAKCRTAEISEELYSDTICFIPGFRFYEPPELGDTRSAVYVTSEAPSADSKGFKSFLVEIEKKWNDWNDQNKPDFFPESKLIPWSITSGNKLIYGSGTKNLISVVAGFNQQTRAAISIILQGTYGDDIPQTAFIVIGSDVKGGFFSYNFIDFYLSSIPIEWDWINSFNKSLDKLSSFNRKASSYTLKPYSYYVWKAQNDIKITKGIIGGLGRNGFEEKKWHSFEGLILNKEYINTDYDLVEDETWKRKYTNFKCPKDYLNEFLVRFTNPVPSIEEIQQGELIGIRRPKIYLFAFEGRGWTIFALNIHGISMMSSHK